MEELKSQDMVTDFLDLGKEIERFFFILLANLRSPKHTQNRDTAGMKNYSEKPFVMVW